MRRTIAFAVLILMGASCSGDQAGAGGGEEARLQLASQGLCDAQVLASEADVRRAADVFDRETHAYLHELAAELQEIDRAAAADLLEAKQRLESALADPAGADPQGVVVLITDLQRALGDAAEAAALPAPLCRDGAS
ncbi:MAG: hypothetical protein ACRDKA_01080 [Actinomycetota bacterium]